MPPIRLLLAAIPLLAFLATAQSPTATLVGTVRDSSGAPIPEAAIDLRHTETNETRQAKSDLKGEFAITNIAPGFYAVVVQKSGFRRLEEDRLELQVKQTARLEVKLEVARWRRPSRSKPNCRC